MPRGKFASANQKHYPDWVVTCHQYAALISQMLFHGETTGGVVKCRLFSQAINLDKKLCCTVCLHQGSNSVDFIIVLLQLFETTIFFCSYSQLLFKAAEWKSLPLMAASLAEGKNIFYNSLLGFNYQSALLDCAHHCDTIFMGRA